MRTNIAMARKRMQIAATKVGTPVTITWQEWPAGTPVNAVTGAYSGAATTQSITTNAFVHSVQPAMTAARTHAEVQAGDCILDIPNGLYRVATAGSTALTVGQLVDEATLNAANEALTSSQTAATATELDLSTLQGAYVTINGERWVQREVGNALASAWDSTVGGVTFCRSMLLRRAP